MNNSNEEKHYIALSDVCLLLNRDPVHVQEFFKGSEVEPETVDGNVVMDVQGLLEHVEIKFWELTQIRECDM